MAHKNYFLPQARLQGILEQDQNYEVPGPQWIISPSLIRISSMFEVNKQSNGQSDERDMKAHNAFLIAYLRFCKTRKKW